MVNVDGLGTLAVGAPAQAALRHALGGVEERGLPEHGPRASASPSGDMGMTGGRTAGRRGRPPVGPIRLD